MGNPYDDLNAGYTPNIQDIRNGYALFYANSSAEMMTPEWVKATEWAEANFNRWLKNHDEKVRSSREHP